MEINPREGREYEFQAKVAWNEFLLFWDEPSLKTKNVNFVN